MCMAAAVRLSLSRVINSPSESTFNFIMRGVRHQSTAFVGYRLYLSCLSYVSDSDNLALTSVLKLALGIKENTVH